MTELPIWEQGLEPPTEEPAVAVQRAMNAAEAVEFERQERLKREQGAAPTWQPRQIKLHWYNDLQLQIEDVTLVAGFLDQNTFGLLVGKPGTAKTFFAIDLALHIAAGRPWFGRDVKQGAVVYVAAEAGDRIINRIIAFKVYYSDDAVIQSALPFAVVTSSVNLYAESSDTTLLAHEICEGAKSLGDTPVKLIIIDTLSRAMPGGNENSPEDMTAFVGNIDQLRELTKAGVLVVHHQGKEEMRGARGHSSLVAAVDSEITIERNEESKVSVAKITKQRDMAMGDAMAYRLDVVELGYDTSGNPITSCVVIPVDAPPAKNGTKAKTLSAVAKVALDRLRMAIAEKGEPASSNRFPPGVSVVPIELWRRYFYTGTAKDDADPKKQGETQRKQFQRARTDLQAAKIVEIWAEEVCILG